MNILFVSSYYLFRESRFGGSKRLYMLAKELGKQADVSVICLDGSKELGDGAAQAAAQSVDHPDFSRFLYLPWTDSRTVLKKFLSSGIIIEDMLKENSKTIGSFLGDRKYDAAFLAFPLGLSFIGTVIKPGSFPIVYSEDDLFLEKVRTERSKGLSGRLYRFVRMKQLRSFYRKKLAFCDTLVAISGQEKEILNRYFPSLRVELLGYGIDLDAHPFLASGPDDFTLGFIGNFLHTPNIDALRWCLRSVFPEVKRVVPGVRMVIAGHALPDAVRQEYGIDPSISWQGEVADLGDFYRAISVFINPIVSGRGMRTKLIEAAAFGRPIVSTRLGAEGMEGLFVDSADSSEELARLCGRLKRDTAYGMAIAKKNRTIIERDYSISAVGKRLFGILSLKTGKS
jgi:glycosyltransferase involved in cell wall biosynthesis